MTVTDETLSSKGQFETSKEDPVAPLERIIINAVSLVKLTIERLRQMYKWPWPGAN